MSQLKYLTGIFCFAIMVSGCAGQGKRNQSHSLNHSHSPEEIEEIASRSEKDFKGLEAQFEEIEGSLDKEDLSPKGNSDRPEDVSQNADADDREDRIKLEFNAHVKKWIRYFVGRSKDRFQRYLNRGEKYRDVVEEVLRQHGLPPELYYLAMIESGYSNNARSPMAAVGAWQFIPGTGRRYGLDLNRYIDERRDPIRATEAASRYLTDLFNVFNSWYLAMAAYNAGEGRVLGAIMRGNTRDFWELVRQKKLPRETRNYVPKFMAAAIIGRNPERFGFQTPRAAPYPDVTAVELPSPVHLKTIAKEAGISLTELKKVNAHLLRGVTPPNKSTYDVWVPAAHVASVKKISGNLSSQRIAGLSTRAFRRRGRNPNYHRVRSGETLSTIAQKYRITISELKRANGLRGNRILAGSRLRVASSGYQRAQGTRHRVRRGETLSSIARKYGTSISSLRARNGLNSNRIYIGQNLRVRGSIGSRAAAPVRRARSSRGQSVHIVQNGENLGLIAQRYGTSVHSLKRMNGLSSDVIYKGMRLKLRHSRASRSRALRNQIHVVRRGENLFRIAKKYGQSVKRIMRLNRMTSKTIHPGTKLVVARR